jgi:BirA family biotin operon repressor/biotin-[acetyl-CoA-carboxylase] ligase
MNQLDLETRLQSLSLGGIRFFQQIPSTNDEAASWIKTGCPDLALVVADEQTAGRGRGGRKWYTPAGSALAFSLVLRSKDQINQLLEYHNTARLNGLGALAVCQALQKKYRLPAKIKWPNDILVNGKKLAGVLAEAHWIGNQLAAVVLGIGINVATASIPPVEWDTLNPHPFPATCVESVLGASVSRWDLLRAVLEELLIWRTKLSGTEFLGVWGQNLAFLGEWVQIVSPGLDTTIKIGQIIALEEDGALQIQEESGELSSLRVGEIHPSDPPLGRFHLRPVDSSKK